MPVRQITLPKNVCDTLGVNALVRNNAVVYYERMERKIFTIPELGIEIEPVINVSVIHRGSSFIYANPKYFYDKIVKENLREFYEDETNERKAINACMTLYHVPEWLYTDKEERKNMGKEVPHNEVLASIVNGTKHFNTGKSYQAGKKYGTHVPKKLIVSNGRDTIELKLIVEAVEKFWDSKIGK